MVFYICHSHKNKVMKQFILLALLLAATQISFAQIRATTESGNKVLLFDDGTWKYEEKKVTQTTPVTPVAAVPAVATPVVTPAAKSEINIDATKEVETELTEVFYTKSPRLVRYFGEDKGRVRCKMSCANTLGELTLKFSWDFQVGDGNRYFGYMKEGTKITIHMQDRQKLELFTAEDGNVRAMEKYNITNISGKTQALSQEQLAALMAQPVEKIEVDWKKKPEEYRMEDPNYFMANLPKVF